MHRLRQGLVGEFSGNIGNNGTIGTENQISYLFEKQELNENLSKFANRDADGQAVADPVPTIDCGRVSVSPIYRCALLALFFRQILRVGCRTNIEEQIKW